MKLLLVVACALIDADNRVLVTQRPEGMSMPITLTAFTVQKEWEGCTWSVHSVDELANAIAIIAVGQALHVANILYGADLAAKPTTK